MEHRKTVTTVAIIAAVLIAALGIGLLVRQARTHHRQQQAAVIEKERAEKAITQQMPGGRLPREEEQKRRSELAKQRAQKLEEMKSMTEEEKRKSVEDQVRSTMGPGGQPGGVSGARRADRPAGPVPAQVAPEPNQPANVAR